MSGKKERPIAWTEEKASKDGAYTKVRLNLEQIGTVVTAKDGTVFLQLTDAQGYRSFKDKDEEIRHTLNFTINRRTTVSADNYQGDSGK